MDNENNYILSLLKSYDSESRQLGITILMNEGFDMNKEGMVEVVEYIRSTERTMDELIEFWELYTKYRQILNEKIITKL